MKKIFTFAAAVLASLTMTAQTITLSAVTAESNWYGVEGVGRVTNKSGNAFSSPDLTCEGSTGFKTGSSYFTIQTYQEISALTIWARSSSNRTVSQVFVSDELSSSAPSATNVEYTLVNEASENYAIAKNACDNEFTITFNSPVAADSYIQLLLSGNADIVAVTFVAGEIIPSTDPVTEVTIAGPTECFVGQKATYTATTDVKATSYQWYIGSEAVEGATSAKFEFTPDATGSYSISCNASNENNSDAASSNVITLTVTERQALEQVVVTDHTTWDFSKAATVSQIKWEGDQKDAAPVVMANIDGMNNDANFNSQALLFSGEYPIRDGKYCQGPHLEFAINAPGLLTIVYSNTGNRTAEEGETEGQEALRRFLTINGQLVPGDAGSMKSNVNTTTANIAVEPGNVVISGAMPYGADPTAAQYIRIYKVIYQRTGWPTAIDNNEVELKAVKRIVNGQLLIEKNGVMYNAQGVVVK